MLDSPAQDTWNETLPENRQRLTNYFQALIILHNAGVEKAEAVGPYEEYLAIAASHGVTPGDYKTCLWDAVRTLDLALQNGRGIIPQDHHDAVRDLIRRINILTE